MLRSNGGGIIGYMDPGSDDTNMTINHVYNTAECDMCTNGNCGGVIGYANARIQDIYNTGTCFGPRWKSGMVVSVGYLRDGWIKWHSSSGHT